MEQAASHYNRIIISYLRENEITLRANEATDISSQSSCAIRALYEEKMGSISLKVLAVVDA